MSKGISNFKKNNFSKSLKYFEEAIAFDPNISEAHFWIEENFSHP